MKENLVKVGRGHYGHLNDTYGRTVCGREVSGKITAKDRRTGTYPLCKRCAAAAPARAAECQTAQPIGTALEDVLKEGDELDARWGTNVFAENDITDAHSEREHGATWCGRTIDYAYTERCHVERTRWAAGLQRCADCIREIQKPAASGKLDDVLDTRAVREVVNPEFRKLPRWLRGPSRAGKTKHMREGPDLLTSMCGILLENTSIARSTAGLEFCTKCSRKARAQEKRGEPWGGGEMLVREYTSGEIREEMRRGLMTMVEFARERGLVWGNGRPVTFSFTEDRDTLHVQPESDPDEGPALCGVDTLSILQGHDRMEDHRVEGSSVCEPCRIGHGYKTVAEGSRRRGGGMSTFEEIARDNGLTWSRGRSARFATEGRILEKTLHVMPPGDEVRTGLGYPALCGQRVRNILPDWGVIAADRAEMLTICRTCRELCRGAEDMTEEREVKAKVEKNSVYSDVPARGVREALEQLLEAYTDHYGPGGVGGPGTMQRAYHCIQVDLRALLEKYPAGE